MQHTYWTTSYIDHDKSSEIKATVAVCVCDGWFKQPQLAESDWTLVLGEAAHLLHIE